MDPSLLAAALAPETVRKTTEEVLSRPEFRPAGGGTDRLMEALRHALAGIAEWAHRNPAAAWLLIALLVLVLLALLAHLGYTFYRAVVPTSRGTRSRGGGKAAWEVLEGAAADWATALSKAKEALAAGDVRRSVWIAHRVLLGLLDERKALAFEAWKTNADYLGECKASGPAAETLQALTHVYDRVVYGHRRADPTDVRLWIDRVEALRAGARS